MNWLYPVEAAADIGMGIVKNQQFVQQDRALRRRKFTDTAYAQYLQGLKSKGGIDVAGQVGRYAGDVYGQAAREQAQTAGNLYKQGMGGSIAGQRTLAEPGMEAAQMVGNRRAQLEDQNREIENRAAADYAKGETQFNDRITQQRDAIREEQRANTGNTLAGLIPLVGGAVADYANSFNKKPPTETDKSLGVKQQKLSGDMGTTTQGKELPIYGPPTDYFGMANKVNPISGSASSAGLYQIDDFDKFTKAMQQKFPKDKWKDMAAQWLTLHPEVQ